MGISYATARLAYRQYHDILYGSLCRLRGAGDWAGAMARMKKASEEDATTELEIIDVAKTTLVSATERFRDDMFADLEPIDHEQGRKASDSSFSGFYTSC